MSKLRIAAFGALIGVLVTLGLPAGTASAHGALTAPVSRAAACGTEGGKTAQSAACRAAIAASAPGAAVAWDNLRVANVNGRDREVIPDGQLCSGGLAQYAGLDLARGDWPTTRITPGAAYTFRYRTTIPHEGTFRLYITKPGYQPGKPLRWDDLSTQPFLSITDPRRVGDSYQLPGRVPIGLAGRHVIYTIWQNSSSVDTYYSCSDVVFQPSIGTANQDEATPASPTSTPPVLVADGGSAGDGGDASAAAGGSSSESPDAVEPSVAAAQSSTGIMDRRRWPVVAVVATTLAIIGTIGLLALYYRPRPRHRRG